MEKPKKSIEECLQYLRSRNKFQTTYGDRGIISEEKICFLEEMPLSEETKKTILNNVLFLAAKPREQRSLAALSLLASLPRTGWERRGIHHVESVLSHSLSVQRAAVDLCPSGLDVLKINTMAMWHDIAEAIIPDFTPHDNIDPKLEHELELIALDIIFPDDCYEKQAVLEYMAQETKEAQWVHDCDKIDPCFVAWQIENLDPRQKEVGLFWEFTRYAFPKLKTAAGRAIFNKMLYDYEVGCPEYRLETLEETDQRIQREADAFFANLRCELGMAI
jgi:5'-deoxynucleotidase YfbR-like HD superfamily hydrolase